MNNSGISGRKIIVLGCPGSGKSSFSLQLHERTGLPLIHLDNIWWKQDRTHISRDEFDGQLESLMKADEWILDGDYSRTYEPRIRTCDTVFFLDYDEEECMEGIRRRVGKERPDIPWIEYKLDPELVSLVQRYREENRPVLLELFEKYPDRQLFIFSSRLEADIWLKENLCN